MIEGEVVGKRDQAVIGNGAATFIKYGILVGWWEEVM